MNRALLLLKKQRRSMCQGCRTFFDAYLRNIAKPRSFKAKAFKRALRAESAAEKRRNEVANDALRREIALRARGWCELDWKHTHGGYEPHHLLSGSAKKIDEKPENVMWVCRHHHDDYHRHRSRYIEPVKEWAARNGLPVPERILRLERRLASLPAPQAPESLPERIAK